MCRASSALTFLVVASALVASLGCSSGGGTGGDSDVTPAPSPAPVNPGEDATSKEKAKDPTTELVVGIDAESFQSQGFAIGSLEIVAKVDGAVAASETAKKADGPLFPRELRLLAPVAKPDAEVEIQVTARDSSASGSSTMPPIVSRLATTRFVKGAKKLAYVFLEIRCNTFPMMGGGAIVGPTCAAPTTCVGGACRSADLGELPDYRADWATSPPSACGSGTPAIDIGQGESQLDGLRDGTTLTMERGPQCGHHVWIGVQMTGLSQSGTTTVLRATQPGSSISVPATGFPYAYASDAPGSCRLPGLRFQLDLAGAKAADFLGKPLDITVEATDKAGRKASAVRHVLIASDIKTLAGPPCP